MHKYNLSISVAMTTLSPVHVGSGRDLKGNVEWVPFRDDEVAAVIDLRKILNIIGNENLNLWVAVIDQGKNLLESLPMLRDVAPEEIAARVLEVEHWPRSASDIKEQLHLAGQSAIPGSSLKGAIRTAILNKLIRDEPSFVQNPKNLGSQKGSFFNYHDKQVNAYYLGKEDRTNYFGELQPSPNKDLLRFLRVGDFHFDRSTVVVKNTIINAFRSGWAEKTRESSYYECIAEGARTMGRIQVPLDTIKQVQDKRYIQTRNFDLLENSQRLAKTINDHTLYLLDREIGFWHDEDNPLAIGDYLEELERIEAIAKACGPNSCVIRLGGNTGWESMTGGWMSGEDRMGDFILEDKDWVNFKRNAWKKVRRSYPDDTIYPKTRKMIDGGMPMGFVKMEFN